MGTPNRSDRYRTAARPASRKGLSRTLRTLGSTPISRLLIEEPLDRLCYYSLVGKLARGTGRTGSFLPYDEKSPPDRRSSTGRKESALESYATQISVSRNDMVRPDPVFLGPSELSVLGIRGLPTPPPICDPASPFLRDRAPVLPSRRYSHQGTNDPHYASKLRGGKVGGTPARKSARDFAR
jgi:hypothetical protein